MAELTARQKELLVILAEQETPCSGQALANRLSVTRQVVVHDIALLRAAGQPIFATPKGYVMQSGPQALQTILAVSHSPEATGTELYILVDHGIHVRDVRVEHRVYGEIIGNLYLSSRRDVELFLSRIRKEQAPLLSSLTNGFHHHLVEYETEEQLAEATIQLKANGIQVL